MDFLIELSKIRTNPDPTPRSLREGPDYRPNWRFLVSEEHLLKVAEAKKKSNALDDILLNEKDPFVRQLVLYQSGRRSVIADSIEYALRCRRSEAGNPIAGMISAMVVAGRSAIQIAQDVGTERRHIVAYEKMFFDVRRYRENVFWIKNLCYSTGGAASMQQNAARWLVTACERGWAGLAGAFSTQPRPKAGAGQTALDQISLGLLSRAADYITSLEMAGVAPGERDIDWLLQMQRGSVEAGTPITLHQLDYPSPVDPEKERRLQESAELVAGLSRGSRRKIVNFLEQVVHQVQAIAEEGDAGGRTFVAGRDA